MAVYGGLTSALGLLFASYREGHRALARSQGWTRFLEALARLSPRITQTLSPEAVLLEALEAARALLPEAVGLEVRSRRGLVGERSPHALPLPLDGDAAHLYLKAPPQEEVPPGFLTLLGERIRQVLKQVEWGALAFTDPLIGLLNRRGLEAELPKLLALARRYQAPLSVVMLDIDHFKRVNDTYGHPVGDEVLKRLGRILQTSVRQEDLAVRYGGKSSFSSSSGPTARRPRRWWSASASASAPNAWTRSLTPSPFPEGWREGRYPRTQPRWRSGSSGQTTPSCGPRRRGGTG